MTYRMEPNKLAPLCMATWAETRTAEGSLAWGDVGVAVPMHDGECWAEVRLVGSSDNLPTFKGCERESRKYHLTCLVHHNRELAARELKCEAEGVTMADIAYSSDADREAHMDAEKAKFRASRAQRTKAV